MDGLPLGYLAPVDLASFLTSPVDQAVDFVTASCIRVIRYAALLASLLLPGLYVAMAVFHQEMLPTKLLLSIIESKQQVPFPPCGRCWGCCWPLRFCRRPEPTCPNPLVRP